MDQSARYADLGLNEDELMAGGGHILVAYKMKPKAGYGYLSAAAHFAAESSTGTNVEVSTTDEFTKGVDALVYHIDEASEDMRIAYPIDLFDRNITDGRMAHFGTYNGNPLVMAAAIAVDEIATPAALERAIDIFVELF